MANVTSEQRRVERELKTVHLMIGMYCRELHGSQEPCQECRALWTYAQQRVDRCPFGADKPTCRNCTVHCYKPAMREQIRAVMRHAGPRMAWRHPIISLLHFVDGRHRPAPSERLASTKE